MCNGLSLHRAAPTADAPHHFRDLSKMTLPRNNPLRCDKNPWHIPLWQVGQVARWRRAVEAAIAVEMRFLRTARPEKSLYMDFSGKEVVEKSGKFPQITAWLATNCRLMGDTCRAFRGNLPRKARIFRIFPLYCSFLARCKENFIPLQRQTRSI